MRFFIILALTLNYAYSASVAGGGASAGPGGAAPAVSRNRALTTNSSTTAAVPVTRVETAPALSPNICTKPEFPNYFAQLESNRAKELINESLSSVLNHLKVPYAENDQILYDGFFRKIQEIVNREAPGATAYISGGMVRSLLGYIYKKMHNMMLDVADFTPGANPKQVIEEVLYDIIHGKRRTDALLSEFDEDRTADKDATSLVKLGPKIKFTPKELTPLQTLGIGSDFDVLIEFPENTTGAVKAQTINAVKTFINSAQDHLGLTNDQSELKRAMVPDADVGEYSKQIDESVKQGGVTIDLLAHPVSGGIMKLPIAHPGIMDDFINGNLRYIANVRATDKQTIRGLRALLEIPFLTFDPDSAQIMAAELRRLIEQKEPLSDGALEQLKKMIRNARFGGAGNRFAGGNCMPDGEITSLIQELARKVGKNTLVPEFVGRRSVESRPVAQDAPTFIRYGEFITKYTDNGILYHGTPDVMNFLSMIRNGLVVSSATQGAARYGYGVYTTKDHGEAEGYTKGTGIVIPLTVLDSARIVDMAIPKHEAHYKAWLAAKGDRARFSFKEYANEFGIDIIVNEHVLIQNAKAIRLEKSLRSIVEADRALVRAKVKAGTGVTIGKVIRTFSTTEGFGKIFPPSEDDLRMVEDVNRRMPKILFDQIFSYRVNSSSDISHILVEKHSWMPIRLLIIDGVMDKIDSVFQLKHVSRTDLLSPVRQSKSLRQLIEAGVINKLHPSQLKDIPADLSPLMQNIGYLRQLVEAGVLCKLYPHQLKDVPADLLPLIQNIGYLRQLIEAGVIDKLLPFVLKDVPADLLPLMQNIGSLQQLIEAGVIDKLRPIDLKDVPADLLPLMQNIGSLRQLIEVGVIDRMKVVDLKYVPAYFSMDQALGLIELSKSGVVRRIKVSDLQHVPAHFSMDQALGLIKLHEAKAITSTLKFRDLLYNGPYEPSRPVMDPIEMMDQHVPSHFSMDQEPELKEYTDRLYDGPYGPSRPVMDPIDPLYFPADFSMKKDQELKDYEDRLFDVLDQSSRHVINPIDLQYVPADFSMEKALTLVQLFKAGVINLGRVINRIDVSV